MTSETKPRPGMSAFYAGMYPELAEVARKHGYALAVHGSLRKDFDLFAIPWIENPSEPKIFLEDLTKQFALRIIGEPDYLFARERWTLHFTFGEAWLDIQFMIRPQDVVKLENRIKELELKLIQLQPKPIVVVEDYYKGTRS